MKIEITIKCPCCSCKDIKKNGKKKNKKQNYLCNDCGRQFIGDHNLTYKGCCSSLINKIMLMFVRGLGIRDIAVIENVSIGKVLSVLVTSNKKITPKQSYYDELEVDEFWTYAGKKKNKLWPVYAYHRSTGEIIARVWGKRNLATVNKLRKKITNLGITFNKVYTDGWTSFIKAFKSDNNIIGKVNTVGIEGNNCRLRHRVRRAFRKTCCFSKKLSNHMKAFDLAFFYIDFGCI